MGGERDYAIRVATEDDYDSIFDFLSGNFFCDEPLNIGMGHTNGPDDPQNMYSMSYIREGKSLLAVTISSSGRETIVGACINSEGTPASYQEYSKTKDTTESTQYKKILTFCDMVEEAMDIWKKTGLDRIFDIRIISVSRSMRRRGLGKSLLERSLRLAKELNYSLAHIGCSSFYSANIVESLGFKCVFKILYSEYKGEDGKPVFSPPSPHKEFKVYTLEI